MGQMGQMPKEREREMGTERERNRKCREAYPIMRNP